MGNTYYLYIPEEDLRAKNNPDLIIDLETMLNEKTKKRAGLIIDYNNSNTDFEMNILLNYGCRLPILTLLLVRDSYKSKYLNLSINDVEHNALNFILDRQGRYPNFKEINKIGDTYISKFDVYKPNKLKIYFVDNDGIILQFWHIKDDKTICIIEVKLYDMDFQRYGASYNVKYKLKDICDSEHILNPISRWNSEDGEAVWKTDKGNYINDYSSLYEASRYGYDVPRGSVYASYIHNFLLIYLKHKYNIREKLWINNADFLKDGVDTEFKDIKFIKIYKSKNIFVFVNNSNSYLKLQKLKNDTYIEINGSELFKSPYRKPVTTFNVKGYIIDDILHIFIAYAYEEVAYNYFYHIMITSDDICYYVWRGAEAYKSTYTKAKRISEEQLKKAILEVSKENIK